MKKTLLFAIVIVLGLATIAYGLPPRPMPAPRPLPQVVPVPSIVAYSTILKSTTVGSAGSDVPLDIVTESITIKNNGVAGPCFFVMDWVKPGETAPANVTGVNFDMGNFVFLNANESKTLSKDLVVLHNSNATYTFYAAANNWDQEFQKTDFKTWQVSDRNFHNRTFPVIRMPARVLSGWRNLLEK